MERIHGGDWAAYREAYGSAPLDFSASVSPLGVPDGVQAAIRRAAAEADRYPDPACRSLRRAVAAHEGVPEAWVLCGSGAADLIWRAVLAAKPGRALVTAPCFGEYEAALDACGCELLRFPLREPFTLTEDAPAADRPRSRPAVSLQPQQSDGAHNRTRPAAPHRAPLRESAARA